MISILYIILALLISGTDLTQTENSEITTVKVFDDAFSLIISEDESTLAVLNGSNYIEIYTIDSLKLLLTVRVSRNAWLDRAFFDNGNKELYYDYGMQANTKYKMLNIATGEKTKVQCMDISKGCSYKSLKCCARDTPTIKLTTKPYVFKKQGIYISMYKLK